MVLLSLYLMRNIYCISGLGADERIFRRLRIEGAKLVCLAWPEHSRNDSMRSYAAKLSAMIEEDNPVLLGVSFGGMLAVEIAKQRQVRKAILVSSAKSEAEKPGLPTPIRWFVTSGIVPPFVYRLPHPALYTLFGTENEEERKLVRSIILDSDGKFVKWAVATLLQWENMILPGNIVHIHGRKDRLIPPDDINADYWIEDGGHMMVYNRASEISRIIEQEIEAI